MLSDEQLSTAYWGARVVVPMYRQGLGDYRQHTHAAGLRAVEAAVRADMQREVQSERHEWCVLTPEGRDWSGVYSIGPSTPADVVRNGKPRYAIDPATGDDLYDASTGERVIEAIHRPPAGSTVAERTVTTGPWLPVTPSTPNQQGAEQ